MEFLPAERSESLSGGRENTMTSDEQEPETLEMVEATVEDLTEMEEEEEEETTEAEESNTPNGMVKHAVFNKYETVYDATFDELHLPAEVCDEIRQTWQALISKMGSREAVGEAIYDTIMDEAPGLKQFFKSPKSVFALRFSNGINSMLSELDSPSSFKKVVETYGFMHLDFAVTVPRVELVREAIISVADMELGGSFTDRSRQCFILLFNYIGGAFVFVLRELADRIRIIQRSWQQVNKKETLENAVLPEGADKDPSKPEEEGEESSPQADSNANKDSKKGRVQTKPNPDQEQQRGSFMVGTKNKNPAMQVPTDFSGMFMFNAAVMGFAETAWMNLVLDRFDNVASNIANTSRVQEECFVLSLCLAKLPDPSSLSLPDFRAVMLAALRSLIPDEWDMNHEVAWNWLWENVERVVSSTVPLPRPYEKAVRNFMFGLQEEQLQTIRIKTYADFFTRCPAGQEYFKQSTTRLYFILDKINEMTVEMFASPLKLVEEISAVGLRHVGYGVPIELIPPFVACLSDTMAEFTTDDMAAKAYSWCLTLISKILNRVIMEGSTVVMKAINTNSEVELKKAISLAPRGQRAKQLLEVSVGTQSISPLYWAIDSGSLSVANAIIEDLLIIRADRDVYYYGCDALFTRHPEVIHRLCNSAPTLLLPLFDGLIWRSRLTSHGFRRVNYYVKHLIQDADGNFNQALQWLCTHGDAKITSHPAVCLAADTVWFRFAVFYFILGRFYFLLTALVFATSQAFLFHHDYKETFEENIATLCCRVIIYLGCLPSMMFSLTRKLYGDFKQGSITHFCGRCCPIPDSLKSFQVVGQLGLMWTFVFMFALEPITYCVNSRAASNYELFSVLCPEGQQIMDVYSILSSIALLIYWFLLTDFSLLSMRVSAFLLVCFYLISEVVLFVLALTFLILAFSTAISALNHHIEDFETVPAWMRALLQISLGMFPNTHYDDFQVEVTVLVAISVFVALVFIFLVNLLIAQLNQAYHNMFEDIYGNARLTRAAVIVQVMAQVPRKRWQNFLNNLAFDQPLEFNEGDVGIAGGIQILEPASAKIVTSDAVKRYGGSTAPTMPWPVEETANLTDEDRFDRLEKMIAKVTSARGKDRRRGGSAAGSKASHIGSSMGSSSSAAS